MTAGRLEFGGNGRAGKVVFTDTQFDLEFGNDAIIASSMARAVDLAILESQDTSDIFVCACVNVFVRNHT